MGHLIIFVYLAALLVGVGATLSVGRLRRTNAGPFLGPLFRYTLFFNFVILAVFSTNYAQTNIAVPYDQRTPAVLLWIFLNNFGGFIAFAGILFGLPAVFRGFQGLPPSRLLGRILAAVAAIFAAGYIAGFVLFLYRVRSPLLDVSRDAFNGLCLLFLWGTAVFHWFRQPKTPLIIARPAVRLFNGLYLAGFSLFFILIFFPFRSKMVFLSLWILGLSGIPLFWLRFGCRGGRGSPDETGEVRKRAGLEEIAAEHDLSVREKEILALLLEGRSNSEIGKALFISIGTVKNHVTSVFKKLGITRRGQLIRFLRGNRD